MSVFELTFSIIIAAAFFIGSVAYIVIGKRRNKSKTYQWKPEQDYDVVQEGESSMTPAYPRLVKREKK